MQVDKIIQKLRIGFGKYCGSPTASGHRLFIFFEYGMMNVCEG